MYKVIVLHNVEISVYSLTHFLIEERIFAIGRKERSLESNSSSQVGSSSPFPVSLVFTIQINWKLMEKLIRSYFIHLLDRKGR